MPYTTQYWQWQYRVQAKLPLHPRAASASSATTPPSNGAHTLSDFSLLYIFSRCRLTPLQYIGNTNTNIVC